jgi:hypothetical protein
MGLAITYQWMFAPKLACGAVRTVLADWILPASDLWAVFPTGRMGNAKARAFAAFVEAELHKHHSGREWRIRNRPAAKNWRALRHPIRVPSCGQGIGREEAAAWRHLTVNGIVPLVVRPSDNCAFQTSS